MTDTNWGDIYKELGAVPVINATGSVTMLGGSTPFLEVREAMDRANGAYVSLMDLEERAGLVIASMADVPAAYVTSGAGSALTLATAACMAGDDDDKIQQLPDTTGMKSEILIQTRQRYWYDRCLELAGGKLVQFGTNESTSRGDLESAIGPNTAAIHYYAVAQEPDEKALSLEDTIEIAHANNIPVLVDAAGQIYPLDLFGSYVRAGADFQCIAAKYMGAPQSTGLALGSVDMIRKLALQSFVSYEGRRVRGVGRPHKVDRQEMVGAVAAVKRWVTLNHEERLADIEEKCRNMMTPLQNIPGVTVTLSDNPIGHQPYGVTLELDERITGISCYQLVDRLKQGNPPIWTRVREGEHFIILHAFGLAESEDIAVGRGIAELVNKIG